MSPTAIHVVTTAATEESPTSVMRGHVHGGDDIHARLATWSAGSPPTTPPPGPAASCAATSPHPRGHNRGNSPTGVLRGHVHGGDDLRGHCVASSAGWTLPPLLPAALSATTIPRGSRGGHVHGTEATHSAAVSLPRSRRRPPLPPGLDHNDMHAVETSPRRSVANRSRVVPPRHKHKGDGPAPRKRSRGKK